MVALSTQHRVLDPSSKNKGSTSLGRVASAVVVFAFYRRRRLFHKTWEHLAALLVPLEVAALQLYVLRRKFSLLCHFCSTFGSACMPSIGAFERQAIILCNKAAN